MRFLCRWHIAWSGVPSSRPVAVAIAFAIVGGTLLETGAIAPASIPSSDVPAPIAAMAGSRDALVAMAATGRDLARVPQDAGVPAPVSREAVARAVPATIDAGSPGAPAPEVAAAAPVWLGSPAGVTPLAWHGPAIDPDLPARYRAVVAGTLAATSSSATRAGHALATTELTAQATRRHAHRRGGGPWRMSPLVTWYGPGFYGHRTACGQVYSRYVVGVAHRTLPCGTLVQFQWHGRTAVAPVIDRGPYGPRNLVFDWSAWLACRVFRPHGMRNGCFTRSDVHYRVVGRVDLHAWFRRRRQHR